MKTAEVKPSDDDPKPTQLPADRLKGQPDDPKPTQLPAEKGRPAPPPIAVLPEYPDHGQGDQVVTLLGVGDPADAAQVRIGCPLPQSITIGGVPYDLSDRAAGTYTFRHK
jgi:hypothetical protein